MATPRGHPVSSGALDADALHEPLCADALHDPLCADALHNPLCADAAGAILVTACHILCLYYVCTMFVLCLYYVYRSTRPRSMSAEWGPTGT